MLAIASPDPPNPNPRSGSTQAPGRLFFFGLLLIFLPTLVLGADATETLGFHAKSSRSTSRTGSCSHTDHPVFSELVTVLRREIKKPNFHVQLRSCPRDMFFAHTRPSEVHGRIFYIDMPATRHLSEDTLGAVFAHELYHVFQFVRFGSQKEVMAYYGDDIKSTELAADFGAGYLLSKTALPNVFEMNPELSGGFRRTRDHSHGTPAERSTAFRQGLYFTRRVSPAYSMENAEAYFLEFGQR